MRRARLTYPGAFHHVMNRGVRGEYIFPDDADKKTFLEILSEKAKLGALRNGTCIFAFRVDKLIWQWVKLEESWK